MKPNIPIVILSMILSAAVLAAPSQPSSPKLAPADESAAFKAAGFTLKGKQWQACEDPTPTYGPGQIDEVRDLNGDGLSDAIISEHSSFCYGRTEAGFSVVSKQADGSWKSMRSIGPGIGRVLETKGAGGWPDIEIGGPGFCFPVERWNGREYVLQRHQYEGKVCKPQM